MSKITVPEHFKLVTLSDPVTTNSGVTTDVINLKNAVRATFVFNFTQAVAHQTVIALYESDDVSSSSTSQVTTTFPIWANLNTSSADTTSRATDAYTYTLANAATNHQVVIQIDPSILSEGYPCVYFTISASSQSTDFVSVIGLIETRYPEDAPPDVITD